MASPSRPSFFGTSRASVDQSRDPRALTKSISSSRLSQVVRHEDDSQSPPKKKKGLKGLIQKMKPKAKRQSSEYAQSPAHPPSQARQLPNDTGTPLAPPPNMAFLSGDGSQRHHRNGSQSSMADSQSQNSNWKMRSVSAPIGGSSSGSPSASPTSSRLRRDSYNSVMRAGGDPEAQRGAIVEMLYNTVLGPAPPANGNDRGQPQQRQVYASPEPGQMGMYDDRRRSDANTAPYPSSSHATGSGNANNIANGYPNPSFRGSRYTSGSMSNSSGIAPTIETPPMPLNATPYFSRPPSLNSPANFSPAVNRFKTLPPLPPQDDRDRTASSPESFQILNDQPPARNWSSSRSYQGAAGGMYAQPQDDRNRSTPRASFDRPTNSPRVEASPRMVHSMYVQPTAGASNPNFGGGGRYPAPSPNQMYGQAEAQGLGRPPRNGNGNGNGFVENEKKGLMSKKGLKGLFGGARAGRLA